MKHILAFLLTGIVSLCSAQTDSSELKQFLVIKKIIQKNVPDLYNHYKNERSEYFMIDIKLNLQKDSIINIDFFKKDKSVHFPHIETAIDKIIKEWNPGQLNIRRMIIPVAIVFGSDEYNFDYPFPLERI